MRENILVWDKWPGASWVIEGDSAGNGGSGWGHQKKDRLLKGKLLGVGYIDKIITDKCKL